MRSELPEYLLRRTGPYTDQIIHLADVGGSRYWLVFKFPYREYGAVLDDLSILNLGDRLVAWDANGKPIGTYPES